MDKKKRRPDHPEYDDTTLYIPSNEWKGFTACMTQYWDLKQDNYEKIFFFKLGKFYEIFYQDAILCNRLLELNWMGSQRKLHLGFPEKALDKYLQMLVNFGYKVAVIEQTETPRMLEQRNKAAAGFDKAKTLKRQICNMVTKGTFRAKE